ncbi:MAG: RagB/SusD family nutrient uptake outer membrane protein [Dysgonamonadaceae bacterium]|jgi:hypothetical protein|nr:RagB/SusD family nutrient uptake outer membrane protein [Dysgonamonadaceae bacterium]
MKNTVFKILTVAFIGLNFCFCADLAPEEDGRLTMDEVFSQYYTTKNYLSKCYEYIPKAGISYDLSDPSDKSTGRSMLASFSDEAQDARGGISSAANDWYNNRTSPTKYAVTDAWSDMYAGIRRCNTFLANIGGTTATINTAQKACWTAEAHTLRAFYYLQLIKRYGGVPIIEQPYEIDYDCSTLRRASFEACVDFIIAECDAALATPEETASSENFAQSFRWRVNRDDEKATFTRAAAWAIKSQAALFAASPLWYASGSKYTWQKAEEITKAALDACTGAGYALYNTPPADGVVTAPNAYSYYFFKTWSPAAGDDKETIYESDDRMKIWQSQGLPQTSGQTSSGAGPSQELVDAYETTDGQPVLNLNQPYLDESHLQPNYNRDNSVYDPANPYSNRDPRFYASIWYNGASNGMRSIPGGGALIPTYWSEMYYRTDGWPENNQPDGLYGVTATDNTDGSTTYKVKSGAANPYFYTTGIGGIDDNAGSHTFPTDASAYILTFDYTSSADGDGKIYFYVGIQGTPDESRSATVNFEATTEWKTISIDVTDIVKNQSWGFGTGGDFLRLNLPAGIAGYTLSIYDMHVNVMYASAAYEPVSIVDTYAGSANGFTADVTNVRYTHTGYYIRKFNDHTSNAELPERDGYMKIFRLAELYLNYAEAAAQAGDAAGALTALNTVRARAGMPALQGLSGQTLINRVRNERRVEFAFEEKRFFDVRRWNVIDQTDGFVTGMKITKKADGTFSYERVKLQNRGTDASKYLMFPINQSEVNKLSAATGANWQNPGW